MSAHEIHGRELAQQLLDKLGLHIVTATGDPVTSGEIAVAWKLAEILVLEVRAEELLERLAAEHEIECELRALDDGGWDIVPDDDCPNDVAMASGDTPLEAVEELRRDLDTPSLAEYTAEQLLVELLGRERRGNQ